MMWVWVVNRFKAGQYCMTHRGPGLHLSSFSIRVSVALLVLAILSLTNPAGPSAFAKSSSVQSGNNWQIAVVMPRRKPGDGKSVV